jgi:hypothetical protein
MTWTRARGVGGSRRLSPVDAGALHAADGLQARTGSHTAAIDTPPARPCLVDLAHADAGDATLTGAKAANLALAQRAGCRCCPAWCSRPRGITAAGRIRPARTPETARPGTRGVGCPTRVVAP